VIAYARPRGAVSHERGREANRAADRCRQRPGFEDRRDPGGSGAPRRGERAARNGNWKSPNLKPWEATLHAYAIRPIQQFAYSRGKNASDMAMVIDAMDLPYARSMDAFAIVSSDADFTPLVMRILTDGVTVYGFGEQKTPEPFVNACSQFTYLEGLVQPSAKPDEPVLRADAKQLRGNTRLVHMLRSAVDAASGDDGWAHLSQVRNQIGNQASFDSRNYGYGKFLDLIETTELFEVKRQDLNVLIRDKRKT
jgi:uncharacterized LabA/DUF88 family protein